MRTIAGVFWRLSHYALMAAAFFERKHNPYWPFEDKQMADLGLTWPADVLKEK